jgi:peptide/nickel transport system permease protein
MRLYITRRLLLIVVNLLVVSMLVFAGMRLLKGDLALLILARGGLTSAAQKAANPEELAALRSELGLDKPVPIQYANWLRLVLTGELGESAYTKKPVTTELARTLPVTIQLAVMATLLAWLMGLPIGFFSAIKQDTWPDTIARLVSIAGLAIPGFWLGALLITVPAFLWGWTPLKPYVRLTEDPLANLQRMFWPALILAIGMAAWLMRMTRAAAVEIMQGDYIRTARAKGLSEKWVVTGHALKNSLIPVLCMGGIQFGSLLAGAVIIEELFALPGLGRLLVQSIFYRDYAVVQAVVLYFAFGVAAVNLIVDLAYAWIDPRIRYH